MNSFIYKVTNLENGKCYVGFTQKKSIKHRWVEHKCNSRKYNNNMLLCKAIRKYGENKFIIEELERGEPEYLLSVREAYWISVIKPEYNLTKGGEGVLGYKHTKETIEKIREKNIGKKETEETKRLKSIAVREACAQRTEEEKIKISNNLIDANTQKFSVEVEGVKFRSQNEMARWASKKYSISINTAIRYYKEGRPFTNKKYNMEYVGSH